MRLHTFLSPLLLSNVSVTHIFFSSLFSMSLFPSLTDLPLYLLFSAARRYTLQRAALPTIFSIL